MTSAPALDLGGRTAVVTGAGRARGLGAAIARRLALAGAKVLVNDLSGPASEPLAELAAEINGAGGTCAVFHGDVTVERDVEAMMQCAVETYGRLDILINNAAIGNLVGPVETFDVADWDRVMAVNMRGAFLGIKHAANVMIAAGRGGRILSIGSQASKSGISLMSAYAASKHGLVGLTRSAAIELGKHNITVNMVCPNHIQTDLGDWQRETLAEARGWSMEEYWLRFRGRVPLGRTGTTMDTADACLFLSSEFASYITGEALNVSGGEEYH